MPRTKITKKRSRGISDEKNQEFEITVDCYLTELEEKYQTAITDVEMQMHKIRSQLPGRALKMKLSEVRGLASKASIDSPVINSSATTSLHSFQASFRTTSPALAKPSAKKQSDEGYATHEETNRISRNSQLATPKVMGPFMSAQKKSRRSRSATGGNYTPQINQLTVPANRTLLKRTQSGLLGSRPSRPKFRTPIMHGRLKAASVDRLMITPKVQPNTPMALLRHARTGESVFSVTGSPVITSVAGDKMANVNIPIGDSVLSIRPTEMGSIDPSYISRIDQNTINHLKVLQLNLNKIMESATIAHRKHSD